MIRNGVSDFPAFHWTRYSALPLRSPYSLPRRLHCHGRRAPHHRRSLLLQRTGCIMGCRCFAHLPQSRLQLHTWPSLLHADLRSRLHPSPRKDRRIGTCGVSDHEHHLRYHRAEDVEPYELELGPEECVLLVRQLRALYRIRLVPRSGDEGEELRRAGHPVREPCSSMEVFVYQGRS